MFEHTLLSDLGFLLSSYLPHVFILAGVGKMIRDLKPILYYKWFAQEGGIGFGGFAILVHQKLDCVVEDRLENFLLLRIEILRKKLYIGGFTHHPIAFCLSKSLSNARTKKYYYSEIFMRNILNGITRKVIPAGINYTNG